MYPPGKGGRVEKKKSYNVRIENDLLVQCLILQKVTVMSRATSPSSVATSMRPRLGQSPDLIPGSLAPHGTVLRFDV